MKKSILAALLLTSLSATSALALPMVSLSKDAGDSSGSGGAFFAATESEGTFKTFCLEASVYVSLGTNYYYNWSNVVQLQNDPISLGSALLMKKYATGDWGATNYGDLGGATGLQQAFWFLEGESGGADNQFVNHVRGILGAQLMSDANGDHGVRVMNLWANSDGTGDKQSQIVYFGVPDAGSTLALLGLALGSLACYSRRRMRCPSRSVSICERVA